MPRGEERRITEKDVNDDLFRLQVHLGCKGLVGYVFGSLSSLPLTLYLSIYECLECISELNTQETGEYIGDLIIIKFHVRQRPVSLCVYHQSAAYTTPTIKYCSCHKYTQVEWCDDPREPNEAQDNTVPDLIYQQVVKSTCLAEDMNDVATLYLGR